LQYPLLYHIRHRLSCPLPFQTLPTSLEGRTSCSEISQKHSTLRYSIHSHLYSLSQHLLRYRLRRSTTGYISFLNGAPIAWQYKRHRCVAGSTWEAECIAGYHAARSTTVIRNLLADIDQSPSTPTPLFIDNDAALKTATTRTRTPPQNQSSSICNTTISRSR